MRNVEITKEGSENLQAILRNMRNHLSRIHHDLNNPLSIISGNVQLLQERSTVLDVTEDFDAPLKDVMAAVEQMTETTDELLVLRNFLAQLNEE